MRRATPVLEMGEALEVDEPAFEGIAVPVLRELPDEVDVRSDVEELHWPGPDRELERAPRRDLGEVGPADGDSGPDLAVTTVVVVFVEADEDELGRVHVPDDVAKVFKTVVVFIDGEDELAKGREVELVVVVVVGLAAVERKLYDPLDAVAREDGLEQGTACLSMIHQGSGRSHLT